MAISTAPAVIRTTAALVLVLLAGCGGREELAPVEYLGGGAVSSGGGIASDGEGPAVEAAPLAPVDRGGITATPLPEPGATPVPAATITPAPGVPVAAGETEVAPGETLNAVSRRTGVPLRDLIQLNGLTAPFTLQPGQKLRLPQAQFHTVAPGDTVYNISKRYGVDQASLMAENGIAPPYTIKLGQRLRIPGRVEPVPAATVAEVPPAAEPVAATPVADVAPPIEIIEPDADSLPPPRTMAAAPIPVPQPGRKPAPPAGGIVTPGATTAAVTPPAAPAASTARFAWPVVGDVISGFGPKAGGQHNDGINIQVAAGTTVRAADAGTVAYAGNEIRGYGNLVLIRHANGWMTAYAHNDQMLVKQGDKVTRGQAIARVGRTGNVTVPQLHFEIRRNGTPIDPSKYMEGSASASG
jgi:murein DD-endopeptidase MepM/ murein hydrolase activator NlpD